MVEVQILGAFEPIGVLPAVAGPIGAGIDQTVQDLEKDRPLHRKAEVALRQQRSDHLLTARLPPQALKDPGGTDARGPQAGQLPPAVCGDDGQGLGEARARLRQGFELARALKAVEGAAVFPAVFDDLEVDVASGLLLAEEDGGNLLATMVLPIEAIGCR